jgi:hypothetical protein
MIPDFPLPPTGDVDFFHTLVLSVATFSEFWLFTGN